MPNYLTMPKQQQILALLALGWSYRRIEAETGVRRETISRYDRRRANAAKTFPGSDRSPPADSLDSGAPDASKAAKTFAGSGSNAAKTFPGSAARPRFTRPLSRGDYREARRRPERAADLAGPRRGVRLRRELRVDETVRRTLRRRGAPGRSLDSAPGAEAQVDVFAARRPRRATGEWRRPWVFG